MMASQIAFFTLLFATIVAIVVMVLTKDDKEKIYNISRKATIVLGALTVIFGITTLSIAHHQDTTIDNFARKYITAQTVDEKREVFIEAYMTNPDYYDKVRDKLNNGNIEQIMRGGDDHQRGIYIENLLNGCTTDACLLK